MQEIIIRDGRKSGWFYLDNEIIDLLAKDIGVMAIAVYTVLIRHSDKDQKCFPSNELISDKLGVSRKSVYTSIKKLEEYNIVSVLRERYPNGVFKPNVYTMVDRSQWKNMTSSMGKSESQPWVNKGSSHEYWLLNNKTKVNNTKVKKGETSSPLLTTPIITKKDNTKKVTLRKFVPPTADEVKAYCKERRNTLDAENFVDFYTSKGWRVGNSGMKDWKAAVRTWERRDRKESNVPPCQIEEL